MTAAGDLVPALRGIGAALLFALACQGCAKPAQVVLYEERQHLPTQQATRGARGGDVPVPPAKPRAAKRGAVEVSELATTTARSFDRTADASSRYRRMPENGIHAVAAGETVYALSRLYGVPVRSLLVLNKLDPPYRLHTGQKIQIPVQRTHVVAQGETVYAISRQFDVSLTELVRLNGIDKPFTIVTGQTLLLPDTQRIAVATAAPVSEGDTGASDDTDNSGSGQPQQEASQQAPPLQGQQTQDEPPPPVKKVVLPPSTNIPQPNKLSGDGFLWPVKGKVISGFGPKGKGLHNDGINIAAPTGAPILAAQHGVVAYSGNELRGFGNLILIKHDKGYMTAYAHAAQILVQRGARVKRGDVIGRVGSTGSVSGPQLHFEIRQGRRPVDPLRHLARERAAKIETMDTAENAPGPKG
jgi:murein DD-endopeptidase MepM/ murein hydrolase activator NlpD